MNKKIFLTATLVGLMVLIPVSGVFAQLGASDDQPVLYGTTDEEVLETTSEDDKLTREQRIAELRGLRAKARCTKITSNIASRLARYQDNHVNVEGRFNGILTKLDKASDRLSEAGANVSKLETYTVDLATIVTELKNLKAEMVTELTNLRGKICSSDEATKTEVRAILDSAKETLGEIRAKAKEGRELVKDTIIPEIKSLISGLRASN